MQKTISAGKENLEIVIQHYDTLPNLFSGSASVEHPLSFGLKNSVNLNSSTELNNSINEIVDDKRDNSSIMSPDPETSIETSVLRSKKRQLTNDENCVLIDNKRKYIKKTFHQKEMRFYRVKQKRTVYPGRIYARQLKNRIMSLQMQCSI